MELQVGLEECKKCNGFGIVIEDKKAEFSDSITCPRCRGAQSVYVAGFPVVGKND